ncbi:hypothetical protein DM01DRAFT_1375627 [Hesseltinella vesiculosa]|uniref:Uncharacterized protein n=1 Tax=Hesseltinella vesiculosa TaxID=101127 RepID=A0A1X2GCM2_9FUNG|nr:hypothetical protein DM01DRAFT_1375627 [Hesseltinella vesiculosa]
MVFIDIPYETQNLILSLQEQILTLQDTNLRLEQCTWELTDKYQTSQTELMNTENKWRLLQAETERQGLDQERLEMQLYTREQEVNALQKELQQAQRTMKDITKTRDIERLGYENERIAWKETEEKLLEKQRRHSTPRVTKRAWSYTEKVTRGQTEDSSKLPFSWVVDTKTYTPLVNLNQNQMTLATQKRIIDELQHTVHQQITQQSEQRRSLQQEISYWQGQARHLQCINQSLMEENEAYQRLTQEFRDPAHLTPPITPVDCHPLDATAATQDALHFNLADELNRATEPKDTLICKELEALKDTNVALRAYVGKLLLRIVESKHTVHVLRINNKPPTTLTIKPPRQNTTCEKIHASSPSPMPFSLHFWQKLIGIRPSVSRGPF